MMQKQISFTFQSLDSCSYLNGTQSCWVTHLFQLQAMTFFGFLTVQCDFSILSNVLCSSATSNVVNCAKKTSKREHLAEWVQSERDAHCRMWSLGRPHPGLGSPSRRLASDSEGCHWPPWSSSATGPTRPSDSHTHTGWTGGYCENNRGTEIEREEAKEMNTCIGTCCRVNSTMKWIHRGKMMHFFWILMFSQRPALINKILMHKSCEWADAI